MAYRFVVPPNWPPPPPGWTPPEGWQPLAEWGPAPQGWQFWVDDDNPQERDPDPPVGGADAATQPAALPGSRALADGPAVKKIPLFGARSKARELAAELEDARSQLRDMGALEAHEIASATEARRREHQQTIETMTKEHAAARARLEGEIATLSKTKESLERELQDLSQRVVHTQETEMLQEVGLYEYHHPLQDAVAYRDRVVGLQAQIKAMARHPEQAVDGAQNWQVNGSVPKGRKMVKDFSKLMLRAYNAEADNLVRGLKPYKLQSAVDRLNRVVTTIERLGQTMDIKVSPAYHRLRIQELELTADYQAKLAQEKEAERAEKERLREERAVQREIQRAREKLEKERSHYQNALNALVAKGDEEAAARLREQMADVDRAIADVDYRAANQRAGYVYVISNLGSFGERVIKVGMTRRLEPMDRVRELGDASVPFNFDVHALFFSDDAVGIEAAMHQRLADRRVNLINQRREFFYATPAEARELLTSLTGELLHFEELSEALEFHQSENTRGVGRR